MPQIHGRFVANNPLRHNFSNATRAGDAVSTESGSYIEATYFGLT